MKGIYIHGLESNNKGSKISYTHTVLDIDSPPINYKKLNAIDCSIHDVIEQDYDFIIGSSMGGYVAYNYAICNNKPMLLLNPSLVYDAEKHPFNYQFTPEELAKYDNKCNVLLGVHDDVVNPNVTKDKLQVTANIIELECGHRIPLEAFKPHLQEFIKTIGVTN
ncbi:MAG: putative esterase YcpF (UPF0227 family) [Saprospiraceae bacterium]|jgi:predicted esterase YcpF (UPF0227 family)